MVPVSFLGSAWRKKGLARRFNGGGREEVGRESKGRGETSWRDQGTGFYDEVLITHPFASTHLFSCVLLLHLFYCTGKTTTINLILGLHSITSGNAVICGQSSKHNVNGVRDLIGVCPQHDILWDELTARETLTMFARLKGLFSNTNAEVEKALAAVRLTTVGDQFVSSYSGGMKRRLSVALATLGSPKAVFLDEPTAGLDPLNKRHIWELVQTLKKDRLVILTSHSMMEADALSDIVAVMAGGQLKAFGPSLKLKERYGLGYHIDIVTKAGNEKAAIDLVRKHMGNAARLDASNAGNLNFSVPSDAVEKLSGFLTILEAESGKNRSLISDFGVSHTTLEEGMYSIFDKGDRGWARDVCSLTRSFFVPWLCFCLFFFLFLRLILGHSFLEYYFWICCGQGSSRGSSGGSCHEGQLTLSHCSSCLLWQQLCSPSSGILQGSIQWTKRVSSTRS